MIDILGTLYTAGTYDPEGQVITPHEPIPGYFVNAVISIPAFEPYTITPTTPSRTFGDAEHTVFLQFQDRAEWLSLGIEYTDDEGQQAFDTSALQAELDKRRWRQTADCSAAQAEVIIEQMGLTAMVDTILADPATPVTVKAALKKAYRWSRRSPAWGFVGTALEMTPEQIDELFVAAQQVEV